MESEWFSSQKADGEGDFGYDGSGTSLCFLDNCMCVCVCVCVCVSCPRKSRIEAVAVAVGKF